MKIRVLIADGEQIVRESFRRLIEAAPDMCVVGVAADGREARELAIATQPDVAVMDASLPEMNGIEVTRHITARRLGTKILMLSSWRDEEHEKQCLAAGAKGFLHKSTAADNLLRSIRLVRLSDELIGDGLKVVVSGITKPEWGKRSRKGDLSEREGEVLALIATGQTNREIGKSLGISIKTVEKHRQSVMKKAHVRETAGLTRLAIRRGYVQVPK